MIFVDIFLPIPICIPFFNLAFINCFLLTWTNSIKVQFHLMKPIHGCENAQKASLEPIESTSITVKNKKVNFNPCRTLRSLSKPSNTPNLYFEGKAPDFRWHCGDLTQLAVRRGEGRSRQLGFEMGESGKRDEGVGVGGGNLFSVNNG